MGDRLWLTEAPPPHAAVVARRGAGLPGAAVSTCPPGVPGCTRPVFPDAGPPADAGEDGGDGGGHRPCRRRAWPSRASATARPSRASAPTCFATMLTQDLRLAASDRGERSRNHLRPPPQRALPRATARSTRAPPRPRRHHHPAERGGVSCAATPTRAGDDTTFLATLLASLPRASGSARAAAAKPFPFARSRRRARCSAIFASVPARSARRTFAPSAWDAYRLPRSPPPGCGSRYSRP